MMKKIGGLAIFALALVSFAGCWGLDPIDPWGGGGNGGGGNGGGGNGGGCDTVIVDPGNGGGGIDTLDIEPWPNDSIPPIDPNDSTGHGRGRGPRRP